MTSKRSRSPFTKTFLRACREHIEAARERAKEEVQSLGQVALQPTDEENSHDEPADVGSEEYAQEINVELLDQESAFLKELDAALERLDGEGPTPFGLCEHCEDEPKHLCPTCPWIPEARLTNSPWVRNCAEVQARLEHPRRGD